jgi:penicillin-binding protein 1C
MDKRRTRRIWRFVWRSTLVLILFVIISILAFQAAVRYWPYPADEQAGPVTSTWITDNTGNLIAAFAGADGNWCRPLSESEISPHLFAAIVAVEDQRYYQHGGVDWQSAASAAWQDLKSLRYRRGASTLTMQLVHLRKPAARSLWVKLKQAIRSCQIEQTATKRQIVIEYLNRAPLGGNLSGVGAASWRYFGKRCADLSLGQAALLAGIPQSPLRFRPDRFPAAAGARRDHVLERMLACGMITQQQRAEAAAEPVDARWHPLPQDGPEEVGLLPTLARLQHQSPGQCIRTTIDPACQRQASAALEKQLSLLAASHVSAGAVVVLDTSSGNCLAAVSRILDRPADAVDLDLTVRPRSSGSALKPFIYAAAFDQGICTPATVLDDSPVAFAGYEPSNYDRQFAGKLSAAEALAQSRNIPALVLLGKVRVDRALAVMKGCGLAGLAEKPDRYGLSLAIGGAETTPMELAEAYATLARGGVPRAVTLVRCDDPRDSATRLVHGTGAPSGRPPSEEIRGAVRLKIPASGPNAILRQSSCLQVLRSIADPQRTFAVYAPAMELAPAWKTGTSSGHRDAWCCAVTPTRTVVVWLGNTNAAGSDALVGQDAAAPPALRILTLVEAAPLANVPGFAPPPGFAASTPRSTAPEAAEPISILSPADHQKILRDPSLPADQQRVPLRARAGGAGERIWWFIDGQCIGSCPGSETLWWDPTPGPHEIRAATAAGDAAESHVDVSR